MLVVYGEPMGKQRHRTGNGHAYTPKATRDYEAKVYEAWAKNPKKRLEGPLKVEITAFYGIPKSKSKKEKADMLAWKIRPTKKPDTDNIAKIVLDALNQLAYDDDKQVVELEVAKFYSDVPRVEIEIKEI